MEVAAAFSSAWLTSVRFGRVAASILSTGPAPQETGPSRGCQCLSEQETGPYGPANAFRNASCGFHY